MKKSAPVKESGLVMLRGHALWLRCRLQQRQLIRYGLAARARPPRYRRSGGFPMSSPLIYAIDKAELDELIAMSSTLTGYIERELNPWKAHELREIFGFIGDILADVERSPITLIAQAEPRV